jgi:hypothetical protein
MHSTQIGPKAKQLHPFMLHSQLKRAPQQLCMPCCAPRRGLVAARPPPLRPGRCRATTPASIPPLRTFKQHASCQ